LETDFKGFYHYPNLTPVRPFSPNTSEAMLLNSKAQFLKEGTPIIIMERYSIKRPTSNLQSIMSALACLIITSD
jgi:hypothetical protein